MYAIALILGLVSAPPIEDLDKPVKITETELARRIVTMHGHYSHVTPKLARKVSAAVVRVTSEPKYRWINPFLLAGLAISESDLRPWVAVGWDCGPTQVRVDLVEKTHRARRELCWKLRRDMYVAFSHAARILTGIKTKWCVSWRLRRAGLPTTRISKLRCLYGVYNAGPIYLSKKWQTCAYKSAGWKKLCRMKRHYWLRGLCFARGVQLGRRPWFSFWRKRRRVKYHPSCRRAYSLAWIQQAYAKTGSK